MDITIRAANVGDLDDMFEIAACPGVVRNTLQLPWVSLDVRRERLENPAPGVNQLVAEVDGKVVGILSLIRNRDRMSHSASFGMSVHDDYQGQGIGTALVRAMVDLADNWLGIQRIELHVYTDNEPAVTLYKNFDFEVEGTHKYFALRDGEYVDAYSMARLRES